MLLKIGSLKLCTFPNYAFLIYEAFFAIPKELNIVAELQKNRITMIVFQCTNKTQATKIWTKKYEMKENIIFSLTEVSFEILSFSFIYRFSKNIMITIEQSLMTS